MRSLILMVSLAACGGCQFQPSLIAESKEQVARKLVDPASAQFRDMKVHESRDGVVAVCGEVNGKNRVGGYAGFRKFYVTAGAAILEPEAGPALTPLDEAESIANGMQFAKAYNQSCLY